MGELLQAIPVFTLFVGAAMVVAGLALCFGAQGKIQGAAALFALVLYSNIVVGMRIAWDLDGPMLAALFLAADAPSLAFFRRLARQPSPLDRRRWAAMVAAIFALLVAIDAASILGAVNPLAPGATLTLNTLTLAQFVVCFISFLPKNGQEARDILSAKLHYLRTDLSLSVSARGRHRMNRDGQKPPNAVDAAIGARIQLARIAKGLGREECAAALGADDAWLARVESGTARADAVALYAIARLLDTTVAAFFADTETRRLGAVLPFTPRIRS